jgi:hypothetical protein
LEKTIKPQYSAKAMTRSSISIQIQKVGREPIIGKKNQSLNHPERIFRG